jgi:outer membrane lipoprotein-sorting protein
MHKIIFTLLIVISALLTNAQPAGYTPVKDVAKFTEQCSAVAQKTLAIKSDFTQEKNLAMLSEKIVSKGQFWFKKDNRLRMEYTTPYKYLMILNGGNMYIKDDKKESTVSLKSNKVFQQINKIILDCVQGNIFNNTDFTASGFENNTTYKVALVPVAKALKDFFKSINITMDKKDFSVTAIEMIENSGDNTILHFNNKELNTTVPDALFTVK